MMTLRASDRRFARIAALFLAMGILYQVPSTAKASPITIYGFWPQDISMGGTTVATEPGPGAAFHNPASAAFSDSHLVAFGVSGFFPQLDIQRSKPFCDATIAPCDAMYPNGYSERGVLLPESNVGSLFGWLRRIQGPFKQKLGVALSMYLPDETLFKVEGIDSGTPHYLLYQDLTRKLVIASSIAWRPVDWLSIGVGAQMFMDVSSQIKLRVDLVNQTLTHNEFIMDLEPSYGATAGIYLRPTENVTIGAAFRQELPLEFSSPTDISFDESARLILELGGTVLFTPHQFDLGASFKIPSLNLELSAQGSLELWSRMRSVAPAIVFNITGVIPEGLGLNDTLDVDQSHHPLNLGLSDIWRIHFGAQWALRDNLQFRGGYQWRFTPVPRQAGMTNLLDNHVSAYSLGMRYSLGNTATKQVVHLDLAFSLMHLIRRTVEKPANDPTGTLSHGGFIFGTAGSATYNF
ncbi:MAG: hypothetical protein CMH54_07435 [Myxococcales bacterium]|nr:hypothetical protein [Myxococcales bacterium]